MNPYDVLGVSKTATEEEIKTAYRKLAKEHHPDMNRGNKSSEDKFKEINAAYDMVKDGKTPPENDGFGGFDPNAFRRNGGFYTYTSNNTNDPNDPFGGMGGNPFVDIDAFFRQATAPRKPTNKNYNFEIAITLEEVYNGKIIEVTIPNENRKVLVSIPSGIQHGQNVRVPGEGSKTLQGIAPGDVVVTVLVRNHPSFLRVGNDIVMRKHDIPLFDFLTGTAISVTTISGKVKTLDIPKNAMPGSKLRVQGEGMPLLNSGGQYHGDLYIELGMVMPRNLTDEQIDLVKKLQELEAKKA